MRELWESISAAKLAYSIILLALIWLLGRELVRVWWDPQLYIGNFKYFANGQPDTGRAEAFGASLMAQHSILRAELDDERRKRSEAANGPEEVLQVWPVAEGTISLPQDLKQLELKIHGFDVGGLLTKLRGWISQPNEVVVTIRSRSLDQEKDLQRVDADVTWLRAPRFEQDKPSPLQHFNTWGSKGDDETAALLASSLVWADAAKHNPDLQKIGRQRFSDWAFAWLQYRIVSYEGKTPDKLTDAQKRRLKAAGDRIAPLLKRKDVYPEVWHLAANLVTLYPDGIPGGSAETYREAYFKALGIEDPVLAASKKQLQDIGATAMTVTAPQPDLVPGSLIWSSDRQRAVRLTAIVTDESGKRFLVFPDLITEGEIPPVEVFSSLGGKASSARVTKRISENGLPAIALAEPADGITVGNRALTAIGTSPAVNEDVRLFTSDKEAKVTSTDATLPSIGGGLIEVSPRFTQAGDAGAPVVDTNGKLVAMAYAGRDEASYLVPLHDLFEQHSLTLAPGP